MSDLPPVGFRAVIENSAGFERAAESIDKVIARISITTKSTSDSVNKSLITLEGKFRTAFENAAKAVTKAHDGISRALKQIEATIKNIASVIAGVLVGAFGILTAAVTGLFSLMNRGASFQGLIDSFERLTGSINVSANALLTHLRMAARGTISDMELLRMANVALAGATGEFATQFAERLPDILKIAGAQARATGQDIDFLFQSLITGIKRGSPMLIDNTGLVLRVEAANQAYADSIGVTVEALTAEQKQIALLNAVIESGTNAMNTFGEVQDTTSNKVARFGTFITNIFDKISLQLQPLFRALLDGVNTFLSGIAQFIQSAGPYIAALVQAIVEALRPLFSAVEGWAEGMNSAQAARAFFMGAANTFGSFLRAVITIATQIMQVISALAQGIANFLLGSSPPPEGPLHDMDTGARATMQAYLDAISDTSLEPVDDVAARIKEILGSISGLDTNQLELRFALLDQSLQPFVEQLELAQAYYTRLAAPLNAALDNVNDQMDSAVQALIRGDAGADELVRSLDAQRESVEGQLEAAQDRVEAAQQQVDLAEAEQAVQRARLEAQQQELEIAQRILEAREAIREANRRPTDTDTGETPTDTGTDTGGDGGGGDGTGGGTEPTGGGGSGDLPQLDTGGAGGAAVSTFEDLFQFDEKEINAAGEEISKAFMEGLGAGTIESFETTRSAMETNVSSLGDAFDALPARINQIGTTIENAIRTNLVNPIAIWLHTAASHFDSTQYGTFAYMVATLPTRIQTWLTQAGANITATGAQISNAVHVAVVAPIQIAFRDFAANFDPSQFGSFAYMFATLPTRIQTWLTQASANITTVGARINNAIRDGIVNPIEIAFRDFGNNFNPAIFGSFAYQFATLPTRIQGWLSTVGEQFRLTFVVPIQDFVNNSVLPLFAGLEDERSIAFNISSFVAALPTTLEDLANQLQNQLVQPFIDKIGAVRDWLLFFFTTNEPGSLKAFLDTAVDYFFEFPNRIAEALQSIGSMIVSTFVVPIVNALNTVIGAFESLINSLIEPIANLMEQLGTAAVAIPGMGFAAEALISGADSLRGSTVSFGRIPVPGARTGGDFSGGLLRVGENGEELIANTARRISVFPNEFLTALDNLSANPQTLPASGAGGGNTYNNSSESNASYTFNNLNNDAQVMQRIALLRSLG